jgi:hypothetical protein
MEALERVHCGEYDRTGCTFGTGQVGLTFPFDSNIDVGFWVWISERFVCEENGRVYDDEY